LKRGFVGDDKAFEQWCAMRSGLDQARAYLRANPEAPRENLYAAHIEGFFDTVCQGNDGKFDQSIGARLRTWSPFSSKDRLPYGASPRARLVGMFVNLSGQVVWWGDRPPKVRDLAVINLLAGLWPGAVRQAQTGGVGASKPTVVSVVRAEENAVRATLATKRRRTR
jgi:hypothetical protein